VGFAASSYLDATAACLFRLRSPDAVQIPAEALKNHLAEFVSVAGSRGTVIGGPIAFHPEQVTAWASGINHANIDAVTGATHLVVNFITGCADAVGNHPLKLRVGLGVG
jgi:hypothetical protein